MAYKAKYCDGKLVPSGPGQSVDPKPCAGVTGTTIMVRSLEAVEEFGIRLECYVARLKVNPLMISMMTNSTTVRLSTALVYALPETVAIVYVRC